MTPGEFAQRLSLLTNILFTVDSVTGEITWSESPIPPELITQAQNMSEEEFQERTWQQVIKPPLLLSAITDSGIRCAYQAYIQKIDTVSFNDFVSLQLENIHDNVDPVPVPLPPITIDWPNITNKPTIPEAQVNSDWNAGSGLAQILNKPTIPVILARSFSTPTFANSTTATQLSTTRDALVSYTYNGTVTISLLAGQSITATLRYADNAGMTTNPVVVDTSITSNSGVLGLTQVNALKLTGIIPAGKFRHVTFSVNGGANAPSALASGQEILL